MSEYQKPMSEEGMSNWDKIFKKSDSNLGLSPHEMLYKAKDLYTRYMTGQINKNVFKEDMTNLNIASNILSRADEFDQHPEIREALVQLASLLSKIS